jgi:hypothetical protein
MWRSYQVWVDVLGRTRLTLVNTIDATLLVPDPAAPIRAALLAQSVADEANYLAGTLNVNGSPAPSTGAYQRVVDVAMLTFTDGTGDLTRIQLPAPNASVFLADGETVDITAIGGIIGAVVGAAITPGGGVVTAYVGGTRQPGVKEVY